MTMDADLEYCRLSLERNDYPHYLLSLLMPADKREALWALGAFRYVIVSIPQLVTDPTLGYMRLTWWRDQIELLRNGGYPKSQPVLKSLREQIVAYNLAFLDVLGFINESEMLIEKPGENFSSLSYDKMIKQILGDDFKKYLMLENKTERILQKYENTKWRGKPPLFALRLWLSSF